MRCAGVAARPERRAHCDNYGCVLDADSDIARRVPVKLGRASVSVIEVAQGLKPGDKVILSDTSAWDEYDRIRLD